MKYQLVSVDFVNMVFTAITYLALAGVGWIFLRLIQACFWLPKQLKKQNDIQQMLQDKVDSYEKYILECEKKEKEAAEQVTLPNDNDDDDNDENVVVENQDNQAIPIDEKKWKERRECLEMLKKELKRVKEGGDMYDWDCLLEDNEKDEDEDDADVNDDDDKKNKNKPLGKELLNDDAIQTDDKDKKYQ
ncbi:hypothetical protein HCN44_006425 [Aphidius gifuensis]|uniref:Uncharacterized protein n=3 Tax=Aphidius gifuensis TaxID=684658 RepID=A0A834Y008_APHGI|nr:probable ATP-dependent RNA helicase ddx52 isoform X2 [Aphidius gifuensis]KAF7995318.1 hypothetical protein HCN44_006425 [Aphidius gifuensis]